MTTVLMDISIMQANVVLAEIIFLPVYQHKMEPLVTMDITFNQ